MSNIDPAELQKFAGFANSWWDPGGGSRTLHDINPCRAGFIKDRVELDGARVIDVGCGGGILAEALASHGAHVTGIDASDVLIRVAREHARETGLTIDYQTTTAEAFADAGESSYDVALCMELIEHVPDPMSLLTACARLVKPGGAVFLSTINRTPKAYALAVVGAEYVLGLLPRGTHDYRQFVRPSEIARWARATRLEIAEFRGMRYNPITRAAHLTSSLAVNYLVHARRPHE